MSDKPERPSRRWSAGRIALALSLAANLMVVGIVAGAFLNGGGPGRSGDPDDRRGPLREIGNAPFVRALERDDRRALSRALRDQGSALRENRAELRRRFQALLAAIRSEPFDAQAVQTLLDDQRDAATIHQRTGERLILEQVQNMTPTQRAAYADRLDAALKRGRRQRSDNN
jgi:uncharacterized membrane protein